MCFEGTASARKGECRQIGVCMTTMMDCREAKACLDEYRILLGNHHLMLTPDLPKGELGEKLGKLNDTVLENLKVRAKEALILSIMILEEMNKREDDTILPEDRVEILTAVNQLGVEIDRAVKVQAEYLRKNAGQQPQCERDYVTEAIEAFKRREREITREEFDRKMKQRAN